MNKFSFIYLFLYICYQIVYTYFGEINFDYQIVGCFLLILLFGIPHGAIDHIVYKKQNNISNLKFFFVLPFSNYFIYCMLVYFP